MPEPEDAKLDALIERAARAYAHELEADVTPHPDTDLLIAFQEARLEPSDADAVQRHLKTCPSCTEEMERLEAFDRADASELKPDPASEAAAARSWARFQELRDGTQASDKGPAASRPGWSAWALAASVLFALVGLGAFFLASDAMRKPTAQARFEARTPFVVHLLPDDGNVQRGTDGNQEVEVPAGMDPLVFQLLLGDQTFEAEVSASLIRSSGKNIWQQTNLLRQPSGAFAVLIPRAEAPPGEYVLRLVRGEGDNAEEMATYSFRLRYGE